LFIITCNEKHCTRPLSVPRVQKIEALSSGRTNVA